MPPHPYESSLRRISPERDTEAVEDIRRERAQRAESPPRRAYDGLYGGERTGPHLREEMPPGGASREHGQMRQSRMEGPMEGAHKRAQSSARREHRGRDTHIEGKEKKGQGQHRRAESVDAQKGKHHHSHQHHKESAREQALNKKLTNLSNIVTGSQSKLDEQTKLLQSLKEVCKILNNLNRTLSYVWRNKKVILPKGWETVDKSGKHTLMTNYQFFVEGN